MQNYKEYSFNSNLDTVVIKSQLGYSYPFEENEPVKVDFNTVIEEVANDILKSTLKILIDVKDFVINIQKASEFDCCACS